MKYVINLLFIILVTLRLGAIEVENISAHYSAMGEAGVAISQGADNIFINTSGLSLDDAKIRAGGEFDSILFNLNYGDIMSGRVFGNFNMNQYGVIGIGANMLTVSIPEKGEIFKKINMVLGYAKYIRNWFGIGIKANYYMWNSIAETVNGITDTTSNFSELNLGVSFIIKYIEQSQFSIVIDNILPTKEQGIDYQIDIISGISYKMDYFTFVLDIEYNVEFNLGVGVEYSFLKNLFFRGGINFRNISDGIVITSGMGYKILNFTIDYAFVYPINIASLGTHKVGINYKF